MVEIREIPEGANIFRDSSFRETLNEWAEAIRQLQERKNSYRRGGDPLPSPRITVRITDDGSSAGFYEFAEVAWDPANQKWATSGGVTHSDLGEARVRGGGYEVPAAYSLTGAIVYLEPGFSEDGSENIVYEFDAPPAIIPVNLSGDGGSQGTNTTAASWTYTATTLSGTQVLTSAVPKNQRPAYGAVTRANFGYVHLTYSGDDTVYTLGWVNERPEYSTVTVETAWRYDATTHKFQRKTINLRVPSAGTESAWGNITDGSQPVAHTLVDDVTYDTSTHKLEQDKRTDMYLLEAGANSDNNLINTAEACDGT